MLIREPVSDPKMLRLLERISAGHKESPLRLGAQVNVWWPRYHCSFQAKIRSLSESGIELFYSDGEVKTYLPNEILSRIAVGEVCHECKSRIYVG